MSKNTEQLTLEDLSVTYQKYVRPFFDNPLCEKAFNIALQYSLTDESLIDEAMYIAAMTAGNDDDELFIVAMLHDIASYHNKELFKILEGFPYKLTKNIQSLRIEGTEEDMQERILKYVDEEFQCIEVARKMYALSFIPEDEIDSAKDLLDTILEYTQKLSMNMALKIQLNTLYVSGMYMYDTLIEAEALINGYIEDEEEDEDYEIGTNKIPKELQVKAKAYIDDEALSEIPNESDQEEYLEHKRLADELGFINKEVKLIESVGIVTYYEGVGFCDAFGELVNLKRLT